MMYYVYWYNILLLSNINNCISMLICLYQKEVMWPIYWYRCGLKSLGPRLDADGTIDIDGGSGKWN